MEREYRENFKAAVESDRNYDIYWLGSGFRAGGFDFEGPHTNEPGGIGHIEGGGLSIGHGSTGRLVAYILTIDYGYTVVQASGGSDASIEPGGPPADPLSDLDLLLAVLQDLRRYPE